MAASCEKDLEIDKPATPEEYETIIRARHLAIIESMGFSVDDIVEQEDDYIVEGDIMIEKAYVDSCTQKTRQAHYHQGWITKDRVQGIRVKNSSNNVPDAGWRQAVRNAINIWNGVESCNVLFYEIEHQVLAHDVKVFMEPGLNDAIATGEVPRNGKPGKEVCINPEYNSYTIEKKTYVMVHEFGHILGLAHTDYRSNYNKDPGRNTYDNPSKIYDFWGTPLEERNSVMYSHSGGRSWGDGTPQGGFTGGDILAIQNMYGTPNYWALIDCDNDVLLPGETKTYGIYTNDLLAGYANNFDLNWSVWAEISDGAFEGLLVDATTRQITVHDPRNTYRPIEMSVSVHYNGVWMGDKVILNQQGAQGFYGVNDEIISSDRTVSGDKVWTSNVTILNGGRMTLTAPLITVVDGFSVEPGGSFVFGG